MDANQIKRQMTELFSTLADGLESDGFPREVRVALTGIGSEHGEEEMMAAAVQAREAGIHVLYLGTLQAGGVETVSAPTEAEAHSRMEELLDSGRVDAAVTMHYPFPVGVSTVGLSVTPGRGRPMFLATTTGTSAADRVEGMIRNCIAGVIAAKAYGIANPSLGILNVDGARQTEGALRQLQKGGYELTFASSGRADGGCIMRGNDVITGAPDIMVTDPLTGNVLSKMLAAFQSGGSFETAGFGYGPGIGREYHRLVLILSRASGAPVAANAIRYAARLVRGQVFQIADREYAAAEQAGLEGVVGSLKRKGAPQERSKVAAPPEEVVTAALTGIDILDLEDAVRVLWAGGIYAQSGMGCTGPVILVSEKNFELAAACLRREHYLPD